VTFSEKAMLHELATGIAFTNCRVKEA